MKSYVGAYEAVQGEWTVQVRESESLRRPLELRLDLRNHSPDGFAWGYAGSGPAQLALAMLADATGDDEVAQRWYQRFKFYYVAMLEKDQGFVISAADVLAMLKKVQEAVNA